MFATVQGSWNLYVINCLIKNFVVNHSGNYGRLGEGVHLFPRFLKIHSLHSHLQLATESILLQNGKLT